MENKIDNIKKLFVVVTILPRGKKDLFIDIAEKYNSNASINFLGHGTASNEIISYLGFDPKEKDILCSVIREDYVKDSLLEIEDKFKTIKNGGVAFAIPFESIIGNSKYLFLANYKRSDSVGK